jgi:sugar phosphate isomerase/epimerase
MAPATVWSVSTSLVASPSPEELPAFYAAAREAGAPAVELSRNVPEETVRAAERLADAGELVVSSLHHPCPPSRDDAGARVEWQITDLDPGNWERAIEALLVTVRQAARLGARAVVVHCGEVDEAMPASTALFRFMRETDGLSGNESARHAAERSPETLAEIARLREAAVAAREAHAAPHLGRALAALQHVVPVAEELGVRLGIESRDYSAQVPAAFEIAGLLAQLPEKTAGYWHDVGHAMSQQAQGTARYTDYLEAAGRRIVGFHLHDIAGTRDHRAPGTGEMDYATLVQYAPPDAVRVLELNRTCTWEDVARGVTLIRAAGLE